MFEAQAIEYFQGACDYLLVEANVVLETVRNYSQYLAWRKLGVSTIFFYGS